MGKVLIPKPKTSFVQVECTSCGNKQVVFSSPSTKVKCLACEKNILNLTGSKATFNAKVLKAVDEAITGHKFSLKRIDRRKEKRAQREAFKEKQKAKRLTKFSKTKEAKEAKKAEETEKIEKVKDSDKKSS